MKAIRLLHRALVGLAVVGCSSISSTHVERDKDLCGWNTTKLHGMPITLEVPHHFKISIVDTYYEKNGNVLRVPPADPKQETLPFPLTSRRVDVVVENTKEIFTVDFVRPAAGTLSTKASLDADRQYFTSIDNKIVDKTIQDITTAVGTLSQALNPLLKTRALVQDATLVQHDRVVAVTFVEIGDPNALVKIHQFLCEHLNGCRTCRPTPPPLDNPNKPDKTEKQGSPANNSTESKGPAKLPGFEATPVQYRRSEPVVPPPPPMPAT
jgi:hypothetical protein